MCTYMYTHPHTHPHTVPTFTIFRLREFSVSTMNQIFLGSLSPYWLENSESNGGWAHLLGLSLHWAERGQPHGGERRKMHFSCCPVLKGTIWNVSSVKLTVYLWKQTNEQTKISTVLAWDLYSRHKYPWRSSTYVDTWRMCKT